MSSTSKRNRALLAGKTPVSAKGKAMAAGDAPMPDHLDTETVSSEAVATPPDPDPVSDPE